MGLYRIMVVDDEAEVRQGITRKIDWAALGFEIAADAENGLDALEKADALDLDIVLTDIKMPFMDGLALGAELARRRPNVKLIILSGFDEFELAKEAIKLNVMEYVLKPVSAEDLTQVLLRARTALDREIAQRRNIAQLNEDYKRSMPLLRERFLHDLLRNRIPPDELAAQAERFGLAVRDGAYKAVVVCDIDCRPDKPPAVAPELVPVSVRQVLDDLFRTRCRREFYMSLSSVILLTGWDADPLEELMRLLAEACAECARIFSIQITVGLSRPCGALGDLYRAYTEARTALEYKAHSGTGRVVYIGDMEHLADTAEDPGSTPEQRLLSAVKFGSREQIAAQLDELLDQGGEVWSAQSRLLGAMGALMPILRRYRLDERETLGDPGQWLRLLNGGVPRGEVHDWLLSVCLRISGCMDQRRVSAAKKLVEEAERYIREQHADSSLSLDRLCAHLHISQSYLSNVFKQETGRSYVQYLTDVRMEHASELLRTTDDKTYLVASQVGYEDPNYFSYVFKKKYGLSPSQYRK